MPSYSTRALQVTPILILLLKCSVLKSLRDANDHQVTVGVGKAGESFKLKPSGEWNTSVANASILNQSLHSIVVQDPLKAQLQAVEQKLAENQIKTEDNEQKIDEKVDEMIQEEKGDKHDYQRGRPLPTFLLDTRKLAQASSFLYQDTWMYNPFRAYFLHHTQKLTNDTQCPPPQDWHKFRPSLTPGEGAMCTLKYIVMYRCKLPLDICVSCPCPEDPHNCPVNGCYDDMSLLWCKFYIGLPMAIVLLHLALSPVFLRLFDILMRFGKFERFMDRFIGTGQRPPVRLGFCTYLLVVQIFASALNVVLYCFLGMFESPQFPWTHDFLTPTWTSWIQLVMNVQMLVNYYVNWSKCGFHWKALLTPNMLIDVFTVHQTLIAKLQYDNLDLFEAGPTSFHGDPEKDFLALARPDMHLHFLRSYRCLTALLTLQEMGALGQFSAINQQVMKSGLRLWALSICATGFYCLVEWFAHDFHLNKGQGGRKNIGECETMTDIHNNFACVPFLFGLYWMFTSMSTVGYGDQQPHSVFGYVFVIFVMVFGISFLIIEGSIVQNVIVAERRGYGNAKTTSKHVVITGGAIRDVDLDMIICFISQLLHTSITDEGCEWPELVILGNVDNPEVLNKVLEKRLSGQMLRSITFCNGNPLKLTGLAQAKVTTASYVFILPSSKSEDWDHEDEFNIHAALSVKTMTSIATTYVLVVFRPASLKVAIMGGLHPSQVCCLNDLRTSIMAQSVRVRGWPMMLTFMTTMTSYRVEGGSAFCKAVLFPDEYLPSCANSVWGFALTKHAAGRSFREFAAEMYQATGALPICAQTQGSIVCFPAHQVLEPDTVIFCINKAEPTISAENRKFISSELDWRTQFLENRAQGHQTNLKSLEKLAKHIDEVPETYRAGPVSEESLEQMRQKADLIVDKSDGEFALAVMTRSGNIWPVITLFVDKFPLAGKSQSTKLDGMGLIFLVPEAPPQEVVDYLGALDPRVQLTFVVDEWVKPEVLVRFGAQKCKVLVSLPTRSLRSEPSNDSKTFVLLRLLYRLRLRSDCFLLIELTSGMKGAHMIPPPSQMIENGEEPVQPPFGLMEEAFNTCCASGSVFVPRSLVGMLARSYYTPGLLEVAQALTIKSCDDGAMNVEQISLPPGFFGKTYKDLVLAFLHGTIGPEPCLVLGLLRETLYSEAVMLNPGQQSRLQETDLVILMMNRKAAEWAQEQGLRCLGGRRKPDM
mmetsp:Transcript_7501/g.13505  ORF Transcript_7501/g.13505 Transcript_7501/m.13505 type:complete len:1214 (-) Transcript_7501:50-3691(-)